MRENTINQQRVITEPVGVLRKHHFYKSKPKNAAAASEKGSTNLNRQNVWKSEEEILVVETLSLSLSLNRFLLNIYFKSLFFMDVIHYCPTNHHRPFKIFIIYMSELPNYIHILWCHSHLAFPFLNRKITSLRKPPIIKTDQFKKIPKWTGHIREIYKSGFLFHTILRTIRDGISLYRKTHIFTQIFDH